MISEDTILADLQMQSESQIIAIRNQAREVVYGHAEVISGLSQSVTWNPQSAEVVLRIANQLLVGRQSGGGATDPVTMRATLGHPVRFGNRVIMGP